MPGMDRTLRGMGRRSLLCYTKTCDPDYVVSKGHRIIAKELQDVVEGRNRRLILTMPPRHGKSRLATIEAVTWALGLNPKLRVIIASYSTGLAAFHSKECRDRITFNSNYRIPFLDTRVKKLDRSSTDWQTEAGGNLLAAGVGAGITGRGADLIVLDDPYKDYEEAHSETIRNNVWNWYLSTLYTRLSPTGRVVIITTRWHVDDIVGRLLDPVREQEIRDAGGEFHPWRVVNFPALSEGEGDPLGRPVGEALFPERFTKDWLKAKKAELGPYLWSAMYQGAPVQKGGKYVSRDQFILMPKDAVPTGVTMMRYWDLATSEKEKADFTAGAKGFIDQHGNLWIVDITKGQWLWPRARTTISSMIAAEKIPIGIEAQGGFKTGTANLREGLPPTAYMREYNVDKSKLVRALPWIALAGNSKVFVVRGEWNEAFFAEAEAFPDGKNDDQVDAVSGLYTMLRTRGVLLA